MAGSGGGDSGLRTSSDWISAMATSANGIFFPRREPRLRGGASSTTSDSWSLSLKLSPERSAAEALACCTASLAACNMSCLGNVTWRLRLLELVCASVDLLCSVSLYAELTGKLIRRPRPAFCFTACHMLAVRAFNAACDVVTGGS